MFSSVRVTTTVSSEFYHKALDNKISWAEAMRRGIQNILDEKAGRHIVMGNDNNDYGVPLPVALRVQKLVKKVGEQAEQLAALEVQDGRK